MRKTIFLIMICFICVGVFSTNSVFAKETNVLNIKKEVEEILGETIVFSKGSHEALVYGKRVKFFEGNKRRKTCEGKKKTSEELG